MRQIKRRDFLRLSGAAGLLMLSAEVPLPLPKEAYARDLKEIKLSASTTETDLGNGKRFKAWTYNGLLPGPEFRVKEGETLRVVLKNELSEGTTIHWHGLPVPNRMDGVPFVTQKPVKPGGVFVYEFRATPPGTYFYHSHESYQLDRGLYGALIVEPRREERTYDREYTVMLEDWATIDGGGPEASRMGNIRPDMGMMRRRQNPDAPLQEPLYNAYAINGKIFEASKPFKVRKGERIKLRIINPSSSTMYTIRIAGHPLTVTHADGRALVPLEVDVLRIGMGERYDVELYANNPGRWHIYNLRDNSPVSGRPLGTLVYEGIRSKGYSDDRIKRSRVNDYSFFEGIDDRYVKPVNGKVDRIFRMNLSGGMMGSPYWTINGMIYPESDDVEIRPGEKIRFEYFNHSMMPHPMHLHGHFFDVVGTGLKTGVKVKKDTFIIPPRMGRGAIEFVADNPGVWIHHCHNLYHLAGGMANLVKNT